MSLLENCWAVGAGCFVSGSLLGYWLWRWKERALRAAMAVREQSIIDSARRDAESLAREAKLQATEEANQLRQENERALAARLVQVAETEKRLMEREGLITRQFEQLVQEDKSLRHQQEDCANKSRALDLQRAEASGLVQQRREALRAAAHLSEAEAKQAYLKELELDTLDEAAGMMRNIIDDAKARAEEKARRVIGLAIQRYAGEHTFETTSATLALPDEELKGRIIGREGRNIRAFEAATGITVLIDDTPNAVVLSGFDPVRREIAREAMQRLLLDGRIHPTRIEEVVGKVKQEMEESVVRAGEEAAQKVGVTALNPELTKMLGRLKFRHSFSQNILEHSIEVAHLAGMMAAEMGLDAALAKRAGLLHDIGKAVNHEVEGAHAGVGADLARRLGEPDLIVGAIASHHDEVPATSVMGILVSAADAISASRPGARSETMTTYIKRVEALEKIGLGFPGVEKCYAVQAGRELRVMVQPEQITDQQALLLAKNISRKVEVELQYPGQIRVTVIRETRCIEYAK